MKLNVKNGINKTKIITIDIDEKDYHSVLAGVAKQLYQLACSLNQKIVFH